jgi:6-phosphogluconate dehydrogenase
MDEPRQYDIGMVGLGVMGRNFALNLADKGFSVIGYDKDASKGRLLEAEGAGKPVAGASDAKMFVEALKKPRAAMLLVPAGPVVDAVIGDLSPLLETGDLIIDGGNSHFTDTDRRMKALAERGLEFLGVGISGGEAGARNGPSMMPGGSEAAYARVQKMYEAAAAHVGGEPCVAYLGPGSAGHYVKMVHNGIEYGLMQLIAETYNLFKQGLNLNNEQLHEVYSSWHEGELNSYLLQITAAIFAYQDVDTGQYLLDEILDEAAQLGTGMWTSQSAMDLGVPVPTIDMAVAMRNLSALKARASLSKVLTGPKTSFSGDGEQITKQIRDAMYLGMIATFAQGMAQLQKASQHYGYELKIADVARIWRGGCIIRAALLEDIRSAYADKPELPQLLLYKPLADEVNARAPSLRAVVKLAADLGIPAPGLMSVLGYLDSFREAHLPANLIQAQRDYFGAHSYERIDQPGTFHTAWDEEKARAE